MHFESIAASTTSSPPPTHRCIFGQPDPAETAHWLYGLDAHLDSLYSDFEGKEAAHQAGEPDTWDSPVSRAFSYRWWVEALIERYPDQAGALFAQANRRGVWGPLPGVNGGAARKIAHYRDFAANLVGSAEHEEPLEPSSSDATGSSSHSNDCLPWAVPADSEGDEESYESETDALAATLERRLAQEWRCGKSAAHKARWHRGGTRV